MKLEWGSSVLIEIGEKNHMLSKMDYKTYGFDVKYPSIQSWYSCNNLRTSFRFLFSHGLKSASMEISVSSCKRTIEKGLPISSKRIVKFGLHKMILIKIDVDFPWTSTLLVLKILINVSGMNRIAQTTAVNEHENFERSFEKKYNILFVRSKLLLS